MTDRTELPFIALPGRPLNKHEARRMLSSLLERIDNDLNDAEKEELEALLAEYGEKWFK